MLKKVILAIGVAMAGLFAVEQAGAEEYVHGYYRHNGTYVHPYYRSDADGNFYNNWSTYPNINPHTGQMGTHQYPTYGSYSYPSYGTYSYPSYGNYYGYYGNW